MKSRFRRMFWLTLPLFNKDSVPTTSIAKQGIYMAETPAGNVQPARRALTGTKPPQLSPLFPCQATTPGDGLAPGAPPPPHSAPPAPDSPASPLPVPLYHAGQVVGPEGQEMGDTGPGGTGHGPAHAEAPPGRAPPRARPAAGFESSRGGRWARAGGRCRARVSREQRRFLLPLTPVRAG